MRLAFALAMYALAFFGFALAWATRARGRGAGIFGYSPNPLTLVGAILAPACIWIHAEAARHRKNKAE